MWNLNSDSLSNFPCDQLQPVIFVTQHFFPTNNINLCKYQDENNDDNYDEDKGDNDDGH